MVRAMAALLAMPLLLASVGCDTSRRGRSCDGAWTLCEDPGAIRCSRDEDAVEICQLDINGCRVWMVTESCGGEGSCVDGECICEDECFPEGMTHCAGTAIEICREADSGCLFWDEIADCEDDGLACDESTGEAQCLSSCGDRCHVGDQRCNGAVIESCVMDGECAVWSADMDCAEDGLSCSEASGEPQCVDGCVDECPEEGFSECDYETIRTCVADATGCLRWGVARDCGADGLICLEGEEPVCGCPERCERGASRCLGDVVQSCEVTLFGCFDWVDVVDCSTFGLPCDDSSEPADCANGGGDTCDDPLMIYSVPFEISGSSFADDFNDSLVLDGEGCRRREVSAEAVLALDVEEGATIWFMEWADVDVVVSIQSDCGGGCLLSIDDFDRDGIYFDVPSAGRYFIIAETSGPETSFADYFIQVSLVYPEDCGDGVDNDLDGFTDCDDGDCFGDATYCASETNCGDGEDNDEDGAVDCADSDCAASAWCEPIRGIWELFAEGEVFDVVGYSIVFEPDDTATDGYSWTAVSGLTTLPNEPGSGRVTRSLAMSDDAFLEWTFTELAGFDFYGERWSSVFLSSNGFLTFGGGSDAWDDWLENHFALPGVSGLRTDLNPTSDGSVIADEWSDRFALSFVDVPRFGSGLPNTFQIELNDDGSIAIYLLEIGTRNGLIGISSGVGERTYPSETDYVP